MTTKQKSQSIEIEQVKKPIQMIKQIQFKNREVGTFFIITTIDKKIILIQIPPNPKQNKQYIKCIVQTKCIANEVFFDNKNKLLFIGFIDGSVHKMSIDNQYKIVQTNNNYIETQPSQQKTITLMYSRQKYLLIWDINNNVKMLQINTMIVQKTIKLYNCYFTAGISFEHPFTHRNVGCVALNKKSSPIVFDCQVTPKIQQTLQKSLKAFQQQQMVQYEIITMANNIQYIDDEFVLACGSNYQNNYYITLYALQYKGRQQFSFFQISFRFLVKNYILHMSIKQNMLMVCMYNSIVFYNLLSKAPQLTLQRNDLNVTLGFVLSDSENKIKFIVDKGFNFLESKKLQNKHLKLRLRQKTYKPIL